jgi:hypothetical protein
MNAIRAFAAVLALLPSLALAQPTPGPGIPTATGTLSGVGSYCWNGSAVVMCSTGAGATGGHVITDTGSTTAVTALPPLPAGTNTIGTVKVGNTASICVTPTVTAANAYGAKYVVGGKLTFANAFTATGSGILQGVSVQIKKVESNALTFVPFAADPAATTWTDAAVAAINATDVPSVRGPVALTNYSDLGTHTVAYAEALGEPLAPGTTSLFGVLITSAAWTNNLAAGDVQVCVKILQDP